MDNGHLASGIAHRRVEPAVRKSPNNGRKDPRSQMLRIMGMYINTCSARALTPMVGAIASATMLIAKQTFNQPTTTSFLIAHNWCIGWALCTAGPTARPSRTRAAIHTLQHVVCRRRSFPGACGRRCGRRFCQSSCASSFGFALVHIIQLSNVARRQFFSAAHKTCFSRRYRVRRSPDWIVHDTLKVVGRISLVGVTTAVVLRSNVALGIWHPL